MHPQSTLLPSLFEPLVRHETDPPYCIVWTGSRDPAGYGRYNRAYAHRVAYKLAYGPIQAGKWILHRCDNPSCVRPEHLWAGTAADNARDRASKGRGRTVRPRLTDEEWSARQWRKRTHGRPVVVGPSADAAPALPERLFFKNHPEDDEPRSTRSASS